MEGKDSLRLEAIYFAALKRNINTLKGWASGETSAELKDIIENAIQADESILLLYKNLGETWNELTAKIQKEMTDLEQMKQTVEAYHDELNEKIDEVNNYLMALVRDLTERMETVEEDLRTMTRTYFLEVVDDPDYEEVRLLKKDNTILTYDDYCALAANNNIILYRASNLFIPRYYIGYDYTRIPSEFYEFEYENGTIFVPTYILYEDSNHTYGYYFAFRIDRLDGLNIPIQYSDIISGAVSFTEMYNILYGQGNVPYIIYSDADYLVMLHTNAVALNQSLVHFSGLAFEDDVNGEHQNLAVYDCVWKYPFTENDIQVTKHLIPVGLYPEATIVFSELSNNATMTWVEEGITVGYWDILTLLNLGYKVTGKCVEQTFPGGNAKTLTFLFDCNTFFVDEGNDSNDKILFGGWSGSKTRHNFMIQGSGSADYPGTTTLTYTSYNVAEDI